MIFYHLQKWYEEIQSTLPWLSSIHHHILLFQQHTAVFSNPAQR